MLYRLYCSSGNKVGVDEYVCFSEIDTDGYWLRYVEIKANGIVLKYSREHISDSYGMLPEGVWNEVEASKVEYGTVTGISKQLFNSVWSASRGTNEA